VRPVHVSWTEDKTGGFGKADDLKVLEEFSLSLAHVIVRLQRAVDHILSLHKLAFERLDSAPTFRVSPGAVDNGSADNSIEHKGHNHTGLNISAHTAAGGSARHAHT
jgi:hypothetical protein